MGGSNIFLQGLLVGVQEFSAQADPQRSWTLQEENDWLRAVIPYVTSMGAKTLMLLVPQQVLRLAEAHIKHEKEELKSLKEQARCGTALLGVGGKSACGREGQAGLRIENLSGKRAGRLSSSLLTLLDS
eukprot:768131-Hanusia_phi.AAC.4